MTRYTNRFGVPQVILPLWFDTYNIAVSAEHLSIGIYANRGVAPHVDAQDVGMAMCTGERGGQDN